jgi:heptosyltransferase-2
VAGDTGVMHLATAVGTPVAVMLGPTVGAFGFLPYQARATVLERHLPCRPCSSQGGPRCPLGHHRCLELITPEEVAEAVRRLPQ